MINMDTAYPYDGVIKLKLSLAVTEKFEIALRIPAWCEAADIAVQEDSHKFGAGYAVLDREWHDGDEIMLDLHMGVKRILPPEGAVNGDIFAAYQYGPLVLAADKRIADPDGVIDALCDDEGRVEFQKVYCPEIKDAHICLELPTSSGSVRLIDYASAGKTWTDESRCAAWLYRKK
jgi:DUF1680 family protein